MTARRPLVAGNWKMNPTVREAAIALAEAVKVGVGQDHSVHVAVCPPTVFLEAVDEALANILRTYDREGQKKLYDELNQSHIDNAPAILLFYGSNIAVYSADLAGEQPNQQGKDNPVTLYFKQ